MRLKLKILKWTAGTPVAMLNKQTAKKIGVHAETTTRISLKKIEKKGSEFSTAANIVEGLVKKNEIAISSEIRERMDLRKGQYIDVNLAEMPKSIKIIKKKLNGKRLSRKEIFSIISEISDNKLSEAGIAMMISAMHKEKMSLKETSYLVEAIVENGNSLKIKDKIVADKHCVGGIAGNRTTPIVVAICASAGLTLPKSSSKAITSAAGTADVMEVITKIEFSREKLKKILKKTNAFLVWGGAMNLVPADSKLIRIEKSLKLDPKAQLLASIMSKKLALGSNHILIDIPCGKTAKVNFRQGKKLKKKFEKLGKHFKKKIKIVLTDGSQPIGNGIGPVLEMKDVLKVLQGNEDCPKDLKEKSLFLSGKILELTKKCKKGKGMKKAREILESGEALKKFDEIIQAQGRKENSLKLGKFKKNLFAKKSGKITEIDNKKINSLARAAGCPADKSSGIYLYVHKGQKIKKNEKLITIYSEIETRLDSAINFYKNNEVMKIN